MENGELFKSLEEKKVYHQPSSDNRHEQDPVYQEMVTDVLAAVQNTPTSERLALLDNVRVTLFQGRVPIYSYSNEQVALFFEDVLLRVLEQTEQDS